MLASRFLDEGRRGLTGQSREKLTRPGYMYFKKSTIYLFIYLLIQKTFFKIVKELLIYLNIYVALQKSI